MTRKGRAPRGIAEELTANRWRKSDKDGGTVVYQHPKYPGLRVYVYYEHTWPTTGLTRSASVEIEFGRGGRAPGHITLRYEEPYPVSDLPALWDRLANGRIR